MITTTLNRIRAHSPCEDGWRKLLAGLGKTASDDEPLPFARILEINGLDDTVWACRVEPAHAKTWRLFAIWGARQVEHLMEDERSHAALDVAERYANGQATDSELIDAADAASRAAACAAARAASRAAYAAAAAAAYATNAAYAAAAAAPYAAYAAYALNDAKRRQEEKFRELVS